MLKASVALVTLLAVASSAGAYEDGSNAEPDRVEAAHGSPFAVPGPIYDEAGRLIAAPPAPDVRSVRELLLRFPVLPEAVGDASSEPRGSAPPRRGEP